MIKSFAQTFPLQRLSFYFKAYLPDYTLPQASVFAPTSSPAVVYLSNSGRAIDFMKWGYLPGSNAYPYYTGLKIKSYPFARIEQVGNSRLYAPSVRHTQRCLVPATAFSIGSLKDDIRLVSETMFAFAGLWTATPVGNGEKRSFTILTYQSPEDLRAKVARGPVVIVASGFDGWLSGKVTFEAVAREHLRLRFSLTKI